MQLDSDPAAYRAGAEYLDDKTDRGSSYLSVYKRYVPGGLSLFSASSDRVHYVLRLRVRCTAGKCMISSAFSLLCSSRRYELTFARLLPFLPCDDKTVNLFRRL